LGKNNYLNYHKSPPAEGVNTIKIYYYYYLLMAERNEGLGNGAKTLKVMTEQAIFPIHVTSINTLVVLRGVYEERKYQGRRAVKGRASPPLSCTLTQSAPASLIIIPAQFAHRYYFSAVGRLSGDGCPPLSFALCLTNQSAAPASLIIIRPQAIAPRMISTRSLLPAFPCTLLTIL